VPRFFAAALVPLLVFAVLAGAATASASLFSDDFESGTMAGWSSVSGVVVQTGEAFSGAYGARSTGSGGPAAYARRTLSSVQADSYHRVRFKVISRGANGVSFLKLRTASSALASAGLNGSGCLFVRNELRAANWSSAVCPDQGRWHELQIRLNVAGAAGKVQVWYDGSLLHDLSKTDDFGTVGVGVVQLGENVAGRSYDVAYDDVIVDTTPVSTPTPVPTATRTPTATSTPTRTRTPTAFPTATTSAAPTNLFADDFESGNLARWTTSTGVVIQAGQGFAGSYGARAASAAGPGTYARTRLTTEQTDLDYRLRFKLVSRGANGVTLLKLRTTGSTSLFTVNVRSSGSLGTRNELAATTTNSGLAVDLNVWHELKLRAHLAGAGGQVEVWYNGSRVDALSKAEDLGTAPVAVLQLGENASGLTYDVVFDDVIADQAVVDGAPTRTSTRTATVSPSATRTATPTLTPTPLAATDVVLVGAGDVASCQVSADEATAELLDTVVAAHPDAQVFTAGDNAYDSGSATEFANCYGPTWGRHRTRTRPVVGNHEYFTSRASGYFDYFNGPGVYRGAAGDRDKGYYSYNLGTWHVVVLNSNCDKIGGCHAGSAQEQWLRADLAANPAACTLAMSHHALFSSGMHGNQTEMRPMWQALYDADADLVIGGHDHGYERFDPQTPAGTADAARGIRELIVGTGGKSHYGWHTIQPNSRVRNNTAFGVIELTLGATNYHWRFLPVPGSTFVDEGTGACH
jgi:hypothetical protein